MIAYSKIDVHLHIEREEIENEQSQNPYYSKVILIVNFDSCFEESKDC